MKDDCALPRSLCLCCVLASWILLALGPSLLARHKNAFRHEARLFSLGQWRRETDISTCLRPTKPVCGSSPLMLCRRQKHDTNDTKTKTNVTVNFIASCRLEALEKHHYFVAASKLQDMEFAKIETAIICKLRVKSVEWSAFFSVSQVTEENVSSFIGKRRSIAISRHLRQLRIQKKRWFSWL